MKLVLFFIFSFMASAQALESTSTASEFAVPSNWRFGIGLGMQSEFSSVTDIEVGTPTLFSWHEHGYSLIIAVTSRNTEAKDGSDNPFIVRTYKAMLESQFGNVSDFTKGYVRLGVGYTDTDKVFQADGGFVVMPLYIGADFKVMQTPTSFLSVFVQAGSEINFLKKTTPASDFGGISMVMGFRGHY